jgi:hypothetical protein
LGRHQDSSGLKRKRKGKGVKTPDRATTVVDTILTGRPTILTPNDLFLGFGVLEDSESRRIKWKR